MSKNKMFFCGLLGYVIFSVVYSVVIVCLPEFVEYTNYRYTRILDAAYPLSFIAALFAVIAMSAIFKEEAGRFLRTVAKFILVMYGLSFVATLINALTWMGVYPGIFTVDIGGIISGIVLMIVGHNK